MTPSFYRYRTRSLETLERRELLAADGPYISEFMASNEDTLEDGYGMSPDWIEVYNPTENQIDLAGWSLTDDPANLTKWTFPTHASSQLEPFSYRVVFASDRDGIDPENNPHTNFKLAADGEFLALVNPVQEIVSQYGTAETPYPEQKRDVSYGFEGAALASSLIQYVDASAGPTGNTRLTEAVDGSTVFEPSGIDIGNQGSDGKWEQRTYGNDGTIFETGVDATNDDGPALTTFVDNLAAGTYEVFAYLWSDTNNNWDLRAGLEPNAMATYRPTTPGVQSLSGLADGSGRAQSGFASPVLVLEGNRTLYQVSLGERTLAEEESLAVFIDDVPSIGGRSWYDGVGVRASQAIVRPTSEAWYLVPQDNSLGTTWTEVDFDAVAAGFQKGTAAIGYENIPASETSYASTITTPIPTATLSTYLRIPFELADAAVVSGLQLQLQYDDGFVAYLNGRRIAERFAPSQLNYDSQATGSRSDSEVLAGEVISLDRWISLLNDGPNVLAFQHLNASLTSSDYLLTAELLISTASQQANEIRYLDVPTPGGPNAPGFLGFVEDTKFSTDRGFYDQPIDVAISSKTADASIYYTLDGSLPDPSNAAAVLYQAPIHVTRTTNLRAAAFKTGFRPTNVDTHTYIFLRDVLQQDPRRDPEDPRSYPSTWQGGHRGDYEVDARVVEQWSDTNPANTDYSLLEGLQSIPSISLTLDHEDLWDASRGIYPNAHQRGITWRRAGSIEYIDPQSSAEFQYNVGIAMHGSASSYNERLLKHSFRLRFSPQFDGPSKLRFPLFDNSEFDDINQVILRAAFTDAFGTRTVTDRYSPLDSTYMRDVWMRDAQLATGGTAAQSSYVHLYINGLYWGLYNPAERSTDEQFYTAHYGGEEEDWDIVKDFNELVAGNRDAWNAMFGIARSITSSNADAKFQQIQGKNDRGEDDPDRVNYLNMDRFIDYMALHLYAGVEDWPHHNWHAGFNRENPGQGFEFLTWDQEIGLDQLVRDRTSVSDSNSPGELFQLLRRSPEFRLRMADRIQALFFDGGALTVENNQARWMMRADQIEAAIIGESARWGDAREGQRVTAYNTASPLPSGTGQIPRGTQTVPLMTVDHWRDSVTYVNETFFPGALDLFLGRMRADRLFPNAAAPSLLIDGQAQHGGAIASGSQLGFQGPGEIYFTLDATDPREPGGAIHGQRFDADVSLDATTIVNARARVNGQWSPLRTAEYVVGLGDVNGDAVVDSRDIDRLFSAVARGDTDSGFDLNQSGVVDKTDVDYLIETLLGTRYGDFDLNGRVDFADFLILSAQFGKPADATWSEGDATGDGRVAFDDFLLLSQHFGFGDGDGRRTNM